MGYRLILVLVFILSGCGMIQDREHKAAILANPNLDKGTRAIIEEGKIRKGMTKDEVLASWGRPCWYCRGTTESSWGDTWEYNIFGSGSSGIGAGTYLFFNNSGRLTGWSK